MKYKIQFIITCLVITSAISLKAQTLLSPAGQEFTDGNYTFNSSFGEPITLTFQQNNILTQGFQQPNYQIINNTDWPEIKSFEVKVYPNPTDQLIHASFYSDQFISGEYYWEVFSLKGEKLETIQAHEGQTTKLDLSFLSAGSYFLILKSEQGQNIATRKIQKIR